ncbi:MAG TPA: SRPBCC family protein [Pirellulales bacterium]
MKPAEASTPSDTEVLVKRSFDTPAKLVWQAYTEPELVRRWLLGPPGWSMPICEMDVRVGGKYRWRWRGDKDGKEFGFSGEFQEVTPHSKLVHTQDYDAGDLSDSMGQEGAVVTVTFDEANGVTSVATCIKFASKEDRDAAFSTGMTDGMEMSYKLLDGVLAG